MIDVETTLRNGLQAFAAETSASVTPPPVASISLRARTPARTRSRWPKIAVAVGCGALITTSVAGAAGVLPGPVDSVVREFRSWGFDADGGATRMASVTDGEFTYEVWLAPLTGGGQCSYDRVIGPDGDVDHGGSSSCVTDQFAPAGFRTLRYPGAVAAGSAASGQLPVGTTKAEFEFDDGTSFTAVGQRDGWFITTFHGVRAGAKIVAVRALNADDTVVTRHLEPTRFRTR